MAIVSILSAFSWHHLCVLFAFFFVDRGPATYINSVCTTERKNVLVLLSFYSFSSTLSSTDVVLFEASMYSVSQVPHPHMPHIMRESNKTVSSSLWQFPVNTRSRTALLWSPWFGSTRWASRRHAKRTASPTVLSTISLLKANTTPSSNRHHSQPLLESIGTSSR